jgi:hypothetical protein
MASNLKTQAHHHQVVYVHGHTGRQSESKETIYEGGWAMIML